MRLGLLVESEEGLDWQSWRTTLQVAERLGFESVWLSDHLASPWQADRHGLDPWVALAVAAAETERLRLGPLVSPMTFRPPAIVARMAEALADLSGDRFVLGLGLGWNEHEHASFGIPFPQLSTRVALLRDGIARIRDVLGSRRVPLLIGGGGPRATLPLVAKYADQWNLTTASPEVYADRAAQLARLCAECGRDPAVIGRSVATGVLIGREPDDLASRAAHLATLVPPLGVAIGQAGGDVIAGAAALGWLAGTPDQIVARLQAFAAAGVTLVILGHYDLADVAALELIAARVAPEVA